MDEFIPRRRLCRTPLWVGLALVLAGCESLGTTKKFSNPVVPPPPRVRLVPKDDGGPGEGAEGHSSVNGEESESESGAAGRASLASAPDVSADHASKTARRAPYRASGGKVRPAAGRIAGTDGDDEDAAELRDSDPDDAIEQVVNTRPAYSPVPDIPSEQVVTRGAKRSRSRRRSKSDELTALKSSTETEGAGWKVEKGEVAATVNGVPIFVDDVLAPIAPQLAEAQKRMPPAVFRKQRAQLIRKFIQPHIERELLLQALRTKVKEENLAQIQKHLDKQIDDMLHEMMKKQGFATMGELELELRKKGESVEELRTRHRNHQLAQQFIASRMSPKSMNVDRPDLLEHYQENVEKFAIPGQVKWQQIHLVYARHGGKSGAQKVAAKVMQRLEDGEDFGTLAREFSNGPTAKDGGHWDWTAEHSLKSKELDEVLFSMPVGEECALIEGPEAIDIVVVHDRREAGYKTFESVQDNIKTELKNAEFHRAVKELLAELSGKATIEMYTDG